MICVTPTKLTSELYPKAIFKNLLRKSFGADLQKKSSKGRSAVDLAKASAIGRVANGNVRQGPRDPKCRAALRDAVPRFCHDSFLRHKQ